jgi:hypothetical protein
VLANLGDFHLHWRHMMSIYDNHFEYTSATGRADKSVTRKSIGNMGSLSAIASLLDKVNINVECKIFHKSEHLLDITLKSILVSLYHQSLKKNLISAGERSIHSLLYGLYNSFLVLLNVF